MAERFLGNIKEKFNNFMDKAMEHAFNTTMEFYEMTPKDLKDEQESIRQMELAEARKREKYIAKG